MENNDLIPFTLEAWETGEYEAVTRNGYPITIYEIELRIFGRYGSTANDWGLINGQLYLDEESEFDLMLRKKTKKVWIPVTRDYQFYTKEECDKCFADEGNYLKAIEVEI